MSSSMMSPAMLALMTVSMMVAMQLPPLASNIWRQHVRGRAKRRTNENRSSYRRAYRAVGTAKVAKTRTARSPKRR